MSARLLPSALIATTISAVVVMALYWGAAYGSDDALRMLLTLTLPQYNLVTALLPFEPEASSWGMEYLIGAVLVQNAVIFTALIFTGWLLTSTLGRRAA
ncbi:MAG: hypothetical protein Q8N13_10605 [Acidovorax sp.]|nr:hypothetical protein [Acidovorax sp.]